MKSLKISLNILISLALLTALSCNKDKDYDKEMYQNYIYLLSASGTANVYTEAYHLKDGESTKYLSIGIGGSNPNPDAITVTLEEDTVLLPKYNKNNFDIDSASFAKILRPEFYDALPTTVTIPANPETPYVQVPVTVRPELPSGERLSPDTIYMIPVAIKSLSGGYQANPDKFNVLYRVTIDNDYAEQQNVTYYTKSGTINGTTGMSGTKIVRPLTANTVRMYVGNETEAASRPDPATVNKYSIIVRVNPDQSITVLPYGTVDIDMLPEVGYNKYAEEVQESGLIRKRFYLSYRYRLQNTAGTETSDPTWGAWYTVRETLTRN
ncbi:MAG: DUF4361 domain-containing protein [Bacteroidales bacterium]|jgi:hypothetical protein|nr:DUF4361 domain-containing protein [Bacteroidales bacterium]